MFTMALFFIVLAVLAGGMLPVQGVVNGQLGRVLDNVVLATLISFVVGSLTLLLVFLFRNNWVDDSGLQRLPEVPPVLYVGGVLGAFYVTLVAMLVPKIGVSNTMIAIIFGQVLLSLLLDHFGFLGIEVRGINWLRILGSSLVLTGLILVVKN
jgi:transporter family-2 protein